jgi:ParB family chromosome partitioning protein
MGGLDVKAAIERIIIKERIRKDITKISELAEDIKRNGLLNPVTLMRVEGGALQLLAGLRRIRAVQLLGWADIEGNVVAPADAEAALRIEISENEQREPFTYSEKMDYARILEEIESAKALERKKEGQLLGGTIGGRGRSKDDSLVFPGTPSYQDNGDAKKKTRDIVGGKIGMSGVQYDRAKYIADNATPEVIEQLDRGERTIRGTYDELRAKEKTLAALTDDDSTETEDFIEETEDDGLPETETESEPAPETSPKPKSEPSVPKRAGTVSEEELMKHLSERTGRASASCRNLTRCRRMAKSPNCNGS